MLSVINNKMDEAARAGNFLPRLPPSAQLALFVAVA